MTRLVPLRDIRADDNDKMQTAPENEHVLTLCHVRENILENYALDPLRQAGGSMRVNVYEHNPVLHDEIYPYHLVPPIALLSRYGNIMDPPHILLSGKEWVQQARNLGLDLIRVIFVQD